MKQLLFSAILLFFTCFVSAQIVINASDLPVIGLKVEQGIDSSPGAEVAPGDAGLNFWDFSGLNDDESFELYFRAPQGSPFSNAFPGATIAAVDIDGFYQYLQLTNQGLLALGVAGYFENSDSTTIPIVIPFTPPQTFLPLPATYNQSFDENIRSVIQLPGNGFVDSIRVVSHVHRTVKIDAYGLMITPAGQFNTLRLKEHRSNVDSTFAYATGLWLFIDASEEPDTSINYSWWGKIDGYAFPVAELEMDPQDPENLVFQATWVKDISTKTSEPAQALVWRLYPNPASESVTIELPEGMDGVRLEMFDLQGRRVAEKNISGPVEQLPLGSLAPNPYVVVLKNRQGRVVGAKVLEVR